MRGFCGASESVSSKLGVLTLGRGGCEGDGEEVEEEGETEGEGEGDWGRRLKRLGSNIRTFGGVLFNEILVFGLDSV